jgi:branched-chain amino acid aminotransferase
MTESEQIWKNGKLIPWKDAQIHVLSHVVHYGSSCFEGIRCYKTSNGPRVFRLGEHIRRFLESARIYRMAIPFNQEVLTAAVLDTIRANRLEACYVRPVVFRGYGSLSVNPEGIPIETYIAVWEWGAYLGKDALENGVDVRVASWARSAPNTLPFSAKAGGNYLNSQLIKMEALRDGYSEGIALDPSGYVSEGSGENIFLVRDGVLYTPTLAQSVLSGITRNTVQHIAGDLGIEVREPRVVHSTSRKNSSSTRYQPRSGMPCRKKTGSNASPRPRLKFCSAA